VIDVARPDPNVQQRRLRRALVPAAVVAGLILGGVGFWLRSGEVPERTIHAVAVQRPEGIEVLWAQRSAAGAELAVSSASVQRRVFGPLWLRSGAQGATGQVAAGELVRTLIDGDAASTYRVRAQLIGAGGSVTSESIVVSQPHVGARERLSAIDGVVTERTADGSLVISWQWPDLGADRIMDRVQIIVVDRAGNPVTRLETRQLGVIVGSEVVAASPRGLEIRVRGIASDGVRTPWGVPVVTGAVRGLSPTPMAIALDVDADRQAFVRWSLPDIPSSRAVGGFQVRVLDPRTGIVTEVRTTSNIAYVEDLRPIDTGGAMEVRVRAVTNDGTRSLWSDVFRLEPTDVRRLTE
jgi:hypothetical protein